jgi:hypothetical protein
MNVRLKTAHGYLSFQPDGRIEYRAVAGSWENLDVEGLTVEPVAPGPGTPTPPPTPPGPTPEMSAHYVQAVKAQLEAAGVNLVGPCGAFAITKRVAWGLRGAGIGLLDKPGGNQCDGYSVDVLVLPGGGDIVDILSDGGGQNTPSWYVREREVDPSRWRPPVQP